MEFPASHWLTLFVKYLGGFPIRFIEAENYVCIWNNHLVDKPFGINNIEYATMNTTRPEYRIRIHIFDYPP